MNSLNKNKTLLALSLTVVMVAGSSIPALAAIFQDTQYHWAKNAIQQLSDERVIGGYPDGSFRPEGSITRAEFAAILVNALGLNAQSSSYGSFNDVPSSHWAAAAIETVKSQGLVSGYPGGLFMPNKNISRAESLAILANAARLPLPDQNTANQILSSYRDQSGIPTWARPAVAAAIQANLFANDPSSGNLIEPMTPASRAEIAAMTSNLRANLGLAAGSNNNQQTANTTPNNNNNGNWNQQQPSYNTNTPNPNALQGRITAVPAATKFSGTLTSAISTGMNRVGDQVIMNIDQPLIGSDGGVVIPAGSKIVGQVASLEAPGMAGKHASMGINFTEIQTPDNRRFQITASVDTEDGLLRGGTTKGRVGKALGKAAIGAGLGAALGTAMGPLSGGSVGKGAIYGTAVGAAVGAGAAAIGKGEDVVVTTGDKIQVKLDQPLTVTADSRMQINP